MIIGPKQLLDFTTDGAINIARGGGDDQGASA